MLPRRLGMRPPPPASQPVYTTHVPHGEKMGWPSVYPPSESSLVSSIPRGTLSMEEIRPLETERRYSVRREVVEYFSPQVSFRPRPSVYSPPTPSSFFSPSPPSSVAKKEDVLGGGSSATYTMAVSSGFQDMPPNQLPSKQIAPCFFAGITWREASIDPPWVQISTTCLGFAFLSEELSSVRNTATFSPEGDGRRHWICGCTSTGGICRFVASDRGIWCKKVRFAFPSTSFTDRGMVSNPLRTYPSPKMAERDA
mmetsp:Transcript_3875/g.4479  ORF Transcript_3875/g.4479 Transcript_3875/m.4479 type:complete len:254 (-) Transcript_3875:211-972(-)